MNGRHELRFLSVFATLALGSSAASAQDIAGRVHLHLELPLLSASYRDADPGGSAFGVDVGSPTAAHGLGGLGVGATAAASAGIGYALDEHWVPTLGVRISHSNSEGVGDATAWSMRPGVRYVFGEPGGSRLFASASVSFGSFEIADIATTLLGGDLQAGFQLSLGDRASVDPFLGLSYGHASQEGDDGPRLGVVIPEQTSQQLALIGGFHLSVWL